jgi:hypothetical protein
MMGKLNRIVNRQNQRDKLAYYTTLFTKVKPFIQARQALDDAYAKGMKDGAIAERASMVAHVRSLTEAGKVGFGALDEIVKLPVVDTTPQAKEAEGDSSKIIQVQRP